jgi:hypothetical protein
MQSEFKNERARGDDGRKECRRQSNRQEGASGQGGQVS